MFETKGQIIEALIKVIPYPEQITDLNFTVESDDIRFMWRGNHFRISKSGSVEEIDKNMLVGSDLAMLLRELLKRHLA